MTDRPLSRRDVESAETSGPRQGRLFDDSSAGSSRCPLLSDDVLRARIRRRVTLDALWRASTEERGGTR